MSKTFCPIPWQGQAIRNNGDVRVCCHMNLVESKGICRNESGIPFNIGRDNLSDAFNAEILRSTRVSMMNGEWNSNCKRCKDEESAGMDSRRIYESKNLISDIPELFKNTSKDGYFNGPVKHLDLRFGNLCNLACRMCGAADSHTWYKDHVALYETPYFNDTHGRVTLVDNGNGRLSTKDYDWIYSDKAILEFSKIADTVEYVYLVGGEPLIIDSHHAFLQMCIDKNRAKEIILEYNTNLTSIPAKVLEMWKQFKLVRLGCSIDGTGIYQEYQRWPSKWEQIHNNLQKLDAIVKDYPNIMAWLAVTVTILNIWHLPDMVEWRIKNLPNFKLPVKILNAHMAFKPFHLNIQALPIDKKVKVSNLFATKIDYLSKEYPEYSDRIKSLFDSIEKFMNQQHLEFKHFEEFIRTTNILDKTRNQDIKTVCPDLAEYFR